MFDYIGDRLAKAIKNIRALGRITEANIQSAVREIRIALLEADVNYDVVKEFVATVKTKALGLAVGDKVRPEELFIKLIRDELVHLLGDETAALIFEGRPTLVLLVGLQGSGKTTTAGKLANYVRHHNHQKPLLVAADVYRPAAIEQLQEVGRALQVPVFTKKADPVTIIKEALVFAKNEALDYIIVDTAGRLQIDEKMMLELQDITTQFKPQETLLILDAMMGQDAINVIEGFKTNLNLTGAILTKLDGNTKGGVALSVRYLTGLPIKLVGDSEKLDGLSEFNPERMANRILDMGDLVSIAEKVENVMDETEAKNQMRRMHQGKYDLEDFLTNLKQIKKLGPLENILKMLPQARNMGIANLNIDPRDLSHVEAIILAMTPTERHNPSILKASRKQRIARGSGRTVTEVNRLLTQFEAMSKMLKQFKN